MKLSPMIKNEKIKNKNKSAKGGLRHRQLAGRGPALPKIKNKNKSAKGGLRHRQLAGRGPAAERWSAAVELRKRSSEADETQGPRMRTATATVPPAQKRLPESKISNANFCFRQ
ncbi:hypothetical protein [Victivallis vadensis]|uniref:hypothetical protein n=1 Tax=Victivallis vadensis TaxID=172901 RepID=UPI00307F3B4B